jgi:hypothetical protein
MMCGGGGGDGGGGGGGDDDDDYDDDDDDDGDDDDDDVLPCTALSRGRSLQRMMMDDRRRWLMTDVGLWETTINDRRRWDGGKR